MTEIQHIFVLTAVLTLLLLIFTAYKRWAHQQRLETVKTETIPDFFSHQLGNKRDIHLFLPPSYDKDTPHAPFPTLYVNDGQDMDQLHMRETLARLYAHHLIEEIIVVAIPTNEDRLHEYGTAVCANAQGLGKKAAAYGRFMIEELIPVIQAGYPVSTAASKTAVLGMSLGGLSAFDLIWNQPDTFGITGVFSGSFWWRAGEEETAVSPNKLIAHEMVKNGNHRPDFRAFFEAATRDEESDRDNNGVIDAIQDTLELIEALELLGYQQGKELAYFQVEGGRHEYGTWSAVLPHFLRWAFGSN